MKCNQAEKLILLQDSDELAAKQTSKLAVHLNQCEPCRHFQHTLVESQSAFQTLEEPSVKVIQDILREARTAAPPQISDFKFQISNFRFQIFPLLKPALAAAASLVIGLGIFFTAFSPGKVGMELVMNETQLFDTEDQITCIMYSGLSEDDLAFNFLMTYEEG